MNLTTPSHVLFATNFTTFGSMSNIVRSVTKNVVKINKRGDKNALIYYDSVESASIALSLLKEKVCGIKFQYDKNSSQTSQQQKQIPHKVGTISLCNHWKNKNDYVVLKQFRTNCIMYDTVQDSLHKIHIINLDEKIQFRLFPHQIKKWFTQEKQLFIYVNTLQNIATDEGKLVFGRFELMEFDFLKIELLGDSATELKKVSELFPLHKTGKPLVCKGSINYQVYRNCIKYMELPFEIKYGLEMLVSTKALDYIHLSDEKKVVEAMLQEALQPKASETEKEALERVKLALMKLYIKSRSSNSEFNSLFEAKKYYEIEDSLRKVLKENSKRAEKENTTDPIVYKMILTPNRRLLLPATSEPSNRVSRSLKDKEEHLLRISVRADDLGPLQYNAEADYSNFLETLKQDICKGVDVIDRVYAYLGSSNSQMRDHSYWAICESTAKISRDIIHKRMGDFTSCESAAKCASRMGQCFSTTTPTIKLQKQDYAEIDDDYSPSGLPYSDGIGFISAEYMKQVCECLSSVRLHFLRQITATILQIKQQNHNGIQNPPNESDLLRTISQIQTAICQKKFDLVEDALNHIQSNIADVILRAETFPKDIKKVQVWIRVRGSQKSYPVYFDYKHFAKEFPSAIQCRLGPCKGVLCVAPATLLQGKKVIVRKSMKKFDCEDLEMEVIKVSKSLPMYLNRQYIINLLSLKVNPNNIQQLFDEQKQKFETITTDEQAAKNALSESVTYNPFTRNIKSLVRKEYLQDEIVKSTLTLCKQDALKQLKEKAKIFIQKGSLLMGVLDETGLLDEDEVFATSELIDDQYKFSKTIYEGKVAICKSPTLHVGDYKLVRAVGKSDQRFEKLYSLYKNVLVFPKKGFKPITDQISGGDLDGDLYSICAEPKLLFAIGKQSMEYAKPKSGSPAVKRQFYVKDIVDFFVDYIKSDNLGIIDNSHLAFADRIGAECSECQILAKLHSTAVDFAKTGVPVPFEQIEVPKEYPDFMEKKNKNTYRSKTVLGKIYRSINFEKQNPIQQIKELKENPTWLKYGNYTKYLNEAETNYEDYIYELLDSMLYFQLFDEVQLLCCKVVDFPSFIAKPKEYDFMDSLKQYMPYWYQEWLDEFEKLDDKTIEENREEELKAKASAYYMVGMKRANQFLKSKQSKKKKVYFSFAYLGASYLAKISDMSRSVDAVTNELGQLIIQNSGSVYDIFDILEKWGSGKHAFYPHIQESLVHLLFSLSDERARYHLEQVFYKHYFDGVEFLAEPNITKFRDHLHHMLEEL